ncbi:MAG: hypothetical protein ACLU8F_02680 [Clostridia bacterium]
MENIMSIMVLILLGLFFLVGVAACPMLSSKVSAEEREKAAKEGRDPEAEEITSLKTK